MTQLPPSQQGDSAVAAVDTMIEETLGQKRQARAPVLGGARQAPFDGEVLGSFIRYAILHEVRSRLTGEPIDETARIEEFNRATAQAEAMDKKDCSCRNMAECHGGQWFRCRCLPRHSAGGGPQR